jgi:hypothetical protein
MKSRPSTWSGRARCRTRSFRRCGRGRGGTWRRGSRRWPAGRARPGVRAGAALRGGKARGSPLRRTRSSRPRVCPGGSGTPPVFGRARPGAEDPSTQASWACRRREPWVASGSGPTPARPAAGRPLTVGVGVHADAADIPRPVFGSALPGARLPKPHTGSPPRAESVAWCKIWIKFRLRYKPAASRGPAPARR